MALSPQIPNAPWLRTEPPDWRNDRLKDVVPLILGGGTPPSSDPDCWEDGDIVWVTPSDFSRDGGRAEIFDSERKITEVGLKSSAATLLPANTVIMASRATIGAVRIAGTELTTNQGFVSFVCNDTILHHRFLFYVISGFLGEYFAEIAPGTTFSEISRGKAKLEPIAFPRREEQERIAAYLDASCAAIDAAVAAKRQQLKALDALRKTTITHAVTRGLNPSGALRYTDIPWIPETPTHWRVVRLKDVMEFFNTVRVPLSAAERGLMTEKTYDYYGASGIIDEVENYLFDGTYILIAEDGANLLTRSRPLAFVATGKFWVNNHAHILKPRWSGDGTFFVNLLESQDFSLFVTGAAQPKLTMENLGRFKLAVPPIEEQREIAVFIREKDTEFRAVSTQIGRQVETLTAYRKSLIHECVTGQRRITEEELNRVKAHG